MGKSGLISLSLMWLQNRAAMRDESARKRLLDSLIAIVGPTTTTKLTGFPSFNVDVLADPTIASKLERWLAAAVTELRATEKREDRPQGQDPLPRQQH